MLDNIRSNHLFLLVMALHCNFFAYIYSAVFTICHYIGVTFLVYNWHVSYNRAKSNNTIYYKRVYLV